MRVHERARLRFFLFVSLVLDSWRGNFNLLLPSSVQEIKRNCLGVLKVVTMMETFVFIEINYLSIDLLVIAFIGYYNRLQT